MHFPQGQRQQPLNRNCWIGLWLSWLLPEHFSTRSAWDGDWGSVGFAGFRVKCWQRCGVQVWDTGQACSTGRAGGMWCPHIILSQERRSPQHRQPLQRRPGVKLGMKGSPCCSQGLGWHAGMRFTTRVKPCSLEWEEGTGPGAKMSVTLLRS